MGAWTADQLLRAMIDQAPDNVVLIEGADLRITHANPAAREMLRRPLIGESIRDIYAGDEALAIIERVFATGQAETVRNRPPTLHTLQQDQRYYTRTYTPLRDASGTVHALVVTAIDVTADVEGQEARVRSEERSRAEIEKVLELFDEAPVMVAVYSPPNFTLTMANRGMRRLVGDDLVGTQMCDRLPADNSTRIAIERVHATGRAESFETVAAYEGFAGRAFSLSLVPIGEPENRRVMVAAIEVTDQQRVRKDLEAQARDLERARQEAVAAARAKDQVLAMLGHELRNPLQPMLTAVQVMHFDGVSSPALDMLEKEVLYLTRLVDDLLDVSRISRGMLELELEELDIHAIVTRGLELASPLLEHRRHHVRTDIDLAGVGVSGDVQRLAQVVSNLVQNAAKYSAPGSQIRIAAKQKRERIELSITDDGVGIAPELIGRVFDAFVQGDQPLARSSGGLGIGLAVVKNIVEAHRGVVAAYSDGPGLGSTFTVELPAIEITSHSHPPSKPHRARRPDPSVTPVRILIVDDNVEATEILQIGLGALGHHIDIAYDGPAALEMAKTVSPQIALLDIGLPVMDGYQLATLMRAAHHFPIVAITGYGQSVDKERSRVAGFAAHLVKPVDLGDLAVLIETLTAASQRAR